MRTFGGRVNCLSPMNVNIKGKKTVVERLSVHCVGDAAAGVTPDRLSFGRLTLSRVGSRDSEKKDTQIVQNVHIAALMALTEYLHGDILDTYAAGGAADAFFNVPFDVLPKLKPGLANGLFLRTSDYLEYEVETASGAVWDALVHAISREEMSGAEAVYTPIFDQKPYSLSNVGDVGIGKNAAYILLRPDSGAVTSTISRIEVSGGGVQYARYNGWQELLDDTEARMEANAGATYAVIDIGCRGQDRPALANDPVIEITGGTGTMQMIIVRLNWTPSSQESASIESAPKVREMAKAIVEDGGSALTVEAIVRPEAVAVQTSTAAASGTKAGTKAASNAAGTPGRVSKLAVKIGS